MLPDLRFAIGAILATSMLAVTTLGLFTATRLTHQAKPGPLETSRNLAFDDRSDWNQFYDPESARRFEELARKSDGSAQPAADPPRGRRTGRECGFRDCGHAAGGPAGTGRRSRIPQNFRVQYRRETLGGPRPPLLPPTSRARPAHCRPPRTPAHRAGTSSRP